MATTPKPMPVYLSRTTASGRERNSGRSAGVLHVEDLVERRERGCQVGRELKEDHQVEVRLEEVVEVVSARLLLERGSQPWRRRGKL